MTQDELKDVVNKVVLAQGNDFIKELLRDNSIKIGTTKKDFAKNLADAVDSGALTQEMVEFWLSEIEGWGNQHLYMFESPSITAHVTKEAIEASDLSELVGVGHSYEFPEDFALSAVELTDESISMIWHVGKESWPRAKAKDFEKVIEGDTFRFDAYRLRQERSVIRFFWRFDDAHCVILIHRNKDIDHSEAKAVVWEVLQEVGVCDAPRPAFVLSEAVKAASKQDGAKQTRMEVDGGYVELKATLQEGGINQVEAVRHARNAVDDAAFERAQGMFSVRLDEDAGDAISVEVSGDEGRIRIWAQCKRDFVHFVIDRFVALNEPQANA